MLDKPEMDEEYVVNKDVHKLLKSDKNLYQKILHSGNK